MEVGQAGTTCSQGGKALVLARDFVVDVLKHDDENAIKMTGSGARRGTSGFLLLAGGGLRHLRLSGLDRWR
jgi:hypothetical protein